MPGDGFLISAETVKQPGASRLGVSHGLECREGFRRCDEQGFRGIEVADRFSEIRAIDVGDEAKRHRPLAVSLQRFIRHDRSEVGAADADVYNVTNTFASVPLP